MSFSEFLFSVIGLWILGSAIVWADKQWRRLTKRALDDYNEPPENVIPPKRVPPAPPSVKNRRQ